ncbi:MAG: hypothetical protein ACE147_05405 [Candidatus Methylomirabilales bacterium]
MPARPELIRVPRLRAVVAVLLALVGIGFMVFLRRYRGADRTALALAELTSAGCCLALALAWFGCRFGGRRLPAARLREHGLRAGILAGVGTAGLSTGLLAVRWAMDQQAGLVAEDFLPAFLRALAALGRALAPGLAAYAALGAVLGALAGLAVAQLVLAFGKPDVSPSGAEASSRLAAAP